ncbi:MAG TPA: protease modulator HflC [Candidatus Marinimicrobia bacterium]|nr:protease modulator HflC [Candidatus Neomarinimicrobiota bacterium]
MKGGKIILLLLIVLIIVFFSTALFILNETQQAIITQFGKPVGEPITRAGIHLKVPFIQKVLVFDKRILEWDGNPQEIPTKDNKFIYIDTFARWRISDALAFYKSNRSEMVGYSRLDDLLDGAVRDEIANHTLPEIIRSSDREMITQEVESADITTSLDSSQFEDFDVPGARAKIIDTIVENVSTKLEDLNLGIEVIDLQIKRIDYNTEVQKKVFDRMISAQLRIAEKYRAIGQGEKERIMGKLSQKKKEILSQAYLESQQIRGKADAEAVKIYGNAYNRSADSRDFYKFLRTLETYQTAIDSSTTLIMSTDNEFLQYLGTTK